MKTGVRSDRYMVTVIVAGAICFLVAASNINPAAIDVYLGILALFTVAVGSRITVQIPRFKSHVSVSDTFIFLTLLLYGGDFAIILAAIEAMASAWRFCNRKLTVFFNAATMAVSTSVVVLVLRLAGLYDGVPFRSNAAASEGFVVLLFVIALTQFLTNTSLAAVHDSLKGGIQLIDTWKKKYIWTFFTYFIGAISAGLMVQTADILGFGVLLAAPPVIFFVYFSYKMYLKNVEISVQHAEQAEQYAAILESRSDALKESEERFRSAFDHAPIGMGLVSPEGAWLKVNHSLLDILGYSESDLLTKDFQSVALPDDLGSTLINIHDLLSGRAANCQMEQRCVHKTGRIVWTALSVSAANNASSGRPNLIFQIQDITDKKLADEKLKYEANHDALTGLPNRLFFMNKLANALERSRTLNDYNVSVLFIDLDRFKNVNDSLGHIIGDELLQEIASRLRECMRPDDIVARLGGDEFTVLVHGDYNIDEVVHIGDRIQQKFGVPFTVRSHEIYSSASIGILHASAKHITPEDVMRDADTAMYQAKRAGKARHEVFDEVMHSEAKELLRLETDLRRALDRGEIGVFYQPIFELETGRIVCFESLARWEHPDLGTLAPSKFIPLAEEIGLIDQLCEQVLARACREIGSFRVDDSLQFPLSINLSCKQFSRQSLVQTILKILEDSSFPTEFLKLEITESVFFEHQERAITMLNELRSRGVQIDIDDFGTGYSNLGYLQKLPVSALKIDRSFVSMIDEDGNNGEIVTAIITLARNLGLTIVAEGIETEHQLKFLKDLNCENGQGFLLAPPTNFDGVKSILRDHHAVLPQSTVFGDVSSISVLQ